MKRFLVLFFAVISVLSVCAQGMTDQQVMRYIARLRKAGATQSQIVTNLMQRGVNMDQIRRLRNQYESQATGGVRAAAGAHQVRRRVGAAAQQKMGQQSG